MKKTLILVFALILSCNAFPQLEISSFNATGGGYSTTWLNGYQALGVNPANLGWTHENRSSSFSFLEVAANIYAEPLTKDQVFNDLFNPDVELNRDQQQEAAKAFTDKRLWSQAGINWVGFSYNDTKVGGFAFSIRERMLWSTKFNDFAASFMFNGYHDPYYDSLAVNGNDTIGYSTNPKMTYDIYEGSEAQFIWYREINFGYGRKVFQNDNLILFGGLGFKYLIGDGSYNYEAHNDSIFAYSSFSPLFGVEYDDPPLDSAVGKGLIKVANGYGLDFGLTLFMKKFRMAIALNDVGKINWSKNVYLGENSDVWKIETGGLDNYNIFAEGDLIESDNSPNDSGQWRPAWKHSERLPTHLRFGASYQIDKTVEAGIDSYFPLVKGVPGNYEKPVFAFGTRYTPAKWVMLSLGIVSGSRFGVALPLGISFYPTHKEDFLWEVGFGVRDISTYLKQANPNISIAFGFLRFEFGKLKNVPEADKAFY